MALDRQLVVAALPQYEIGGELGRGGNGIVLEGRHRQLDRRVAIKQLPRAFGSDPSVRERFLAEARLVATLDHPHIVPVYDFVEQEGLCLIVMEHLAGGSVWDRFTTEGLTAPRSVAYVLAASVAAHAAHQRGILHRDIKPENVLLNADGMPKLTDFGLAKMLDGSSLAQKTAAGVVPGTPAYIAPEQVLGHQLGPWTDVYTLAMMTYELLSGQLPFPEVDGPIEQLMQHVELEPTPLADVMPPDAPGGLAVVVMKGLTKSPENRYRDAETFAVDLARAMTAGLGPTWLEYSGVPLMGAGDIEVAVRAAPATTPNPMTMTQSIRATHSHLVVPRPGLPEPSAPVSATTSAAAPDQQPVTPVAPAPLPKPPTVPLPAPAPAAAPPSTSPPAPVTPAAPMPSPSLEPATQIIRIPSPDTPDTPAPPATPPPTTPPSSPPVAPAATPPPPSSPPVAPAATPPPTTPPSSPPVAPVATPQAPPPGPPPTTVPPTVVEAPPAAAPAAPRPSAPLPGPPPEPPPLAPPAAPVAPAGPSAPVAPDPSLGAWSRPTLETQRTPTLPPAVIALGVVAAIVVIALVLLVVAG